MTTTAPLPVVEEGDLHLSEDELSLRWALRLAPSPVRVSSGVSRRRRNFTFRVNITKRHQRRKQRDGSIKEYDRYVVSYRDPKTRQRTQIFFERQKEAYDAQRQLLIAYEEGTLSNHQRETPTVAEGFQYWLNTKEDGIKASTIKNYESFRSVICGPLIIGSQRQRKEYTEKGKLPKDCIKRPMLGAIKISELTTAEIRAWHRTVAQEVGAYTANRARGYLQAIMGIVAEDFNVRPPMMPQRLGRGRPKEKKAILLPDQVRLVLREAQKDKEWGVYYAFPFLAGTRPSEQLGLHWEDVDFDLGLIRIHRMLERDGSITDFTKTEAGMREVPMCSLLREMMLEWRERCPKKDGALWLVFPSQGVRQAWPKPPTGGGGVLLYANFRNRVWPRPFKALAAEGVSYVTPHSARHCFISTLQAQGVEVGLVAKLAGHSDPAVTLGHYTQAVRSGMEAIERLADAFKKEE